MNQRLPSVCLFAVVVLAAAESRAVASVVPLVVVVETAAGSGVDPGEVRQIIAAELRAPVRAPSDGAGEEASDLLVVVVDRAAIRMSLRPHATGVVVRAVPLPGDRKARLRSIGWLAGNLARDQVSPLVDAAPVERVAPTVEEQGTPEVAVPPVSSTPTEPPPLAVNPVRPLAPATAVVVAAGPSPATGGDRPEWSLTLGGGPTALWAWSERQQRVGVWSLALQRRASVDGRLILGAALDTGPDMAADLKGSPVNFLGAAALVGIGHRFGRTFLEATGGLGVEVYQSLGVYRSSLSDTGEGTESIPIAVYGLYLRGQASAGLTLWRSFDLLATAGGHLGSVSRFDHFLTGGLGLRYRFPP